MKPDRTLHLRSRLPVALVALLALLQLLQPDAVWMYGLAGLGALLAVSFLWARALRDQVDVERTSRGVWMVVGDSLTESFTLTNRSLWPVLWATVRDHSNIPGYHIDQAVAAASGGAYAWSTAGTCSQRGVFRLGPWSVAMGDPFGLFDVTLAYPEVRTLLVYPRAMHLPDIRLPRGGASGRTAQTRTTQTETVISGQVRPYVQGDALHLIHWRKTAQQQRFMVRQFDLEPVGDLWLAIDLDAGVQAGAGSESTLEYGVVLAASLAAQHLQQNRAVGLVAFGEEMALIPPQTGSAQLWRLLHALARAAPGSAWPLDRVLHQVGPELGRGRTLLAITPSPETAWVGELLRLQRKDIAPAALLLDRASFDPASGSPLPALHGLLADHGVPVHVIDRSYVFRPLATIRRKRTVLKTLGAYGRVVPVEIEEEV